MSIQQIINISKKMDIKLLQKSLLLNLKVNLSTKKKTHYETLGISSNATYNEIKTAYYELTLKYHPDKNKSESAKQIFHEISNAYDVLSKYETRKHYDRTILVKNENTTWNKVDRHRPKETVYYPTSGMDKMYNFDEWVRCHYRDGLKHNFLKKEKMREQEKELQNLKDWHHEAFGESVFIIVIFGTVIVIKLFQDTKESTSKKNDSK